MWRPVVIAMLCAAVSLGFRSNDVSPQATTGTAPGPSGNFSGVGNCASGLYVTGLNNNAPPTCMPVDFAHLTGSLDNSQLPTNIILNNPTFTGTLTLPDGSTWNNTGLTMPITSKITIGEVNITGVAPSLTFNNVPMGGTCTGSDFVNAISETGVPSCATPAGGGTSLPTPVSVANGGLGQGGAPTTGQFLVATSATQYSPITIGGDIGFNPLTGTFHITNLPAGLTINNPTITGTVNLPNGSITDVMLANAYSGVGACPGGQFVHTLNRNAPPGCAAVAAGVTVANTAPASPQIGDLWFDTVGLQLYIRYQNGTPAKWVPTINQPTGGGIGPPGPPGEATVTVSATAPAAPAIGTLWFDTTNVQMYIWYSDGTSTQWVPVTHP